MTAPSPLYFGAYDRPLFGWLHPAAEPSGLGLVICNPFGYEAICAHRSLRHFAQAAAAAGVPALRFDYDGTGDSAGDDRDPDRVPAWLDSVDAAIDALRRHAGVERVCLLGVRLGALLATTAATTRQDVAGLIAIAPVVSGRAHLRELKLLQASLDLAPPPPGTATEAGLQEAIGFALTAATRDALVALDLTKQARPPAPAVLILDRPELPTAQPWSDHLVGQGVGVQRRLVPGYVEMVLDPHKAVVPTALIQDATSWLSQLNRSGGQPSEPPNATALVTPAVRESAVSVAAPTPFGILCQHTEPARTGRAILMLNAGSVHRVGPNRLYVPLARRWAALGHVVLRMDVSGIGDSPPRPGQRENVVYGARALDDVAAGLAFLRAQPGITEVRAVGLCSGAYHAFKAAVAAQPLEGIVAINPLTFFWKEGESLDPPVRVVGDVQRYSRNVWRAASWKKVLRREVSVRRVVRTMLRHTGARVLAHVRDGARALGVPLPGDLGAELQHIARQRKDLHFVFASDDRGLPLLTLQAGTALEALRARGALTVTIIEGPDHTFTPLWSHAPLIQTLGAALDERRP